MNKCKLHTIYKIASYLKIPKIVLIKQAEENDSENEEQIPNILHLDELDKYHIFCSDIVVPYISLFFDYKKFIKHEIWEQVNLAEGSGPNPNRLLMIFKIKDMLMVIRQEMSYERYGGIFFRDSDAPVGYSVEPLINFLKFNFGEPDDS